MAKRRSLEIPSVESLQQLEADYRREGTMPRPAAAPIAQVAAETAAALDPRMPEQRATAARDLVDATAMRQARDKGLVLLELPLGQIEMDALVRDRITTAPEEMEELKASIARTGLRLPIEVFALPGQAGRYGLLSGYRRLMAVQALHGKTGDEKFAQIKVLLRDPAAMGGSFAAMVEENEIRSALSHFERGRIAVIAAQQGAFATVEAAVEALFPVASKAKRSKVRSFALVFEELGDVLQFPEALTEKLGLRLATVLREGAKTRLRAALTRSPADSAEDEAQAIEVALQALTAPLADPSRGGRPKRQSLPKIRLASGYELAAREEGEGWSIQVGGSQTVDRDLVASLIRELERVLDAAETRTDAK